jgi:hypothetical protein
VSIIASCSFVPRYVPPDFGARHKTEDARERQTQRQRNTTPHTTRRGTAPHRGPDGSTQAGMQNTFYLGTCRPSRIYGTPSTWSTPSTTWSIYFAPRRGRDFRGWALYVAAWSSCCYVRAGRTEPGTAAAKGCWQPCCWRWLGAPASSTPPGWTVSVLGVLCRAVRSSNAHRGGALLAQQLWYQAASCESPPGTQQ